MYSEQPMHLPVQHQSPMPFHNEGYPNINVAPVIKIVNGDDKSSSPMIEPTEPGQHPIIVKNQEREREKEKPSESGSKELDFSQPMIIVKKDK
jgi:hypothetical protein